MNGPKRTSIQWEILPFRPVLVRFSVNQEVMSRICTLLNVKELTLEEIQQNFSRLIPILDRFWNKYLLKGAILLTPWRNEVENHFTPQTGNGTEIRMIRAVEPLLVLNVLCRSRAGLLLPNLPLSLEVPFLKRDLVTADQRLILLANKEMYHG